MKKFISAGAIALMELTGRMPEVPAWLKMLLNVALGFIIFIGILFVIFVLAVIAAHT